MMETKWDLGPLVGSSRRIITPGHEPFNARVVAHVFEHADALIIAVAPEMLDALEVVLPYVCSLRCQSVKKTGEPWVHSEECERTQAVIRKAKGIVWPLPAAAADTNQATGERGEG